MSSIYLDHAATTPMVESALIAMTSQLAQLGNPSSLHTHGRAVRKILEDAREALATEIGCLPSEIIFTASGTEANNLALKGLYWAGRDKGKNLVLISSIEHHAILDPAHWLATHENAEVIEIPVDKNGVVDLVFLQKILSTRADEIAVISVMHANNETGVLQPISEIVKIASGIPVHTDAVQSFKKIPLSFSDLGVTAMSLSAHKIGGPLGIGALILKRTVEIPSLLHGGGQEREIRSGTLNAPGIIGFAAAAASKHFDGDLVTTLRDQFVTAVQDLIPGAVINGLEADRLPGIVNVTFPGTQSDTLLLLMDSQEISCSTGSACTAGVHEASHVLLAMGHSDKTAQSSLRFSFGATSTKGECEHVLSVLPDVIARGRAANIS
ncbi:unannotated protein [freshwater metagenome]|uniref:Unannotated protein n=1 Tax=freshwater metagenome TaxID=449393 RepID=A0A6J7I8S2_9ZZZZ|nr:aminotransferase class V-fold PLP-dependent enzyme [Actinomycetota bacterium]